MILSGKRIQSLINHKIWIDPFYAENINPNSYNLSLHNMLYVYEDNVLDMRRHHSLRKLEIPAEGLLLQPQKLYLGRTMEYTKTHDYVPMLEGRSSIGRLGLYVHVTAGFGDVGFEGYWTLEMHCIHAVRIYPFVKICQIFYYAIEGAHEPYSSSKYQRNKGVQGSKLFLEFDKGRI